MRTERRQRFKCSSSKFSLVGYASGGSICWLRGEIVSTATKGSSRAVTGTRDIYNILHTLFTRESEESHSKDLSFLPPNYKELETLIVFSYSIKFLL